MGKQDKTKREPTSNFFCFGLLVANSRPDQDKTRQEQASFFLQTRPRQDTTQDEANNNTKAKTGEKQHKDEDKKTLITTKPDQDKSASHRPRPKLDERRDSTMCTIQHDTTQEKGRREETRQENTRRRYNKKTRQRQEDKISL
jgi:hypothetical protein